jgi:hypothetical protein
VGSFDEKNNEVKISFKFIFTDSNQQKLRWVRIAPSVGYWPQTGSWTFSFFFILQYA